MSIRQSIIGLAALLLAGCGAAAPTPDQARAPAAGERASVIASTNVYASIVSAVGGDRVEVRALINDPAADPHSYESTPADAAAVAGADLVVYNGGGYDDWMARLLEAAGGNRAVVDVAEVSGLATGGDVNEHFWYSLPTAQELAGTVATRLGTADPAHAAEFTANAGSFTDRVGELQARAQAIGAAAPGARVAVTEPVPGYLIESAGLVDVTPPEFAEAIEEDTDPPAAVVSETLALFGPDPVRALIVNAQTETPTTDQVRQAAQTGGVPIVEMTETLPAGATDYLSWMGSQVDALAAAVERR
jgi:zinc/manganese transport system substrate-binding protein